MPWLIRWVLLLQEFVQEIRAKKGSEIVVADHLSKLINEENEAKTLPVQESFLNEQQFQVSTSNLPLFPNDQLFQVSTSNLPLLVKSFH